MSSLVLIFVLLFSFCICQQSLKCPPSGHVRKADPYNSGRFLQCNNGWGYWCVCPNNMEFEEEQQCCVAPHRSTSSQASAQGNARRDIRSNSGRSSGWENGDGVEFDYHW